MESSKCIIWGRAGFGSDDWRFVYQTILKYNIKSVLEYGCGLSTELLTAIDMDRLSLETIKEWADVYKDYGVVYCDKYPVLNRKYDLAFVDGPTGDDRTSSVAHAKQYCDFIYLHDYGLRQFELLKDWEELTVRNERTSHLFKRK